MRDLPVEETTSTSLESVVRRLDGCYHVFLDLGANIGVHARFLFEPQKYQIKRNTSFHPYLEVMDAVFGADRDLNSTCAVEFEPNPRHRSRHLALQEAYLSQGWRYIYAPFGVGNASGSIAFYRNAEVGGWRKKAWWGDRNEDWTFSTTRMTPSETPIMVPVVDIGAFLQRVGMRALDLRHTGKQQSFAPRVLVKMDIEGEEVRVLPHLLAAPERILCKTVDALSIEFHSRLGGAFSLNRLKDADLDEQMRRETQDSSCRFKSYLHADDESFVHDGQPFPGGDTAPPALPPPAHQKKTRGL